MSRAGGRWHRAVKARKVTAGGRLQAVKAGGRALLVGRLDDGSVVAVAAFCPHEGTDLGRSTILDGELRCPQHKYVYEARSGRNVHPTASWPDRLWKLKPGYLPTFPAEERDGWVWVQGEPNPPPPEWDPRAEEEPAAEEAGPAAAPEREADAEAGTGTTEVSVVAGGTAELRVPTTPRAGFLWTVRVEAGLVTVVGERFEPGEGVHVVSLAAGGTSTGADTVTCEYRRPWDAEPVETRTYTVTVTE